jgi:hypothetical protein
VSDTKNARDGAATALGTPRRAGGGGVGGAGGPGEGVLTPSTVPDGSRRGLVTGEHAHLGAMSTAQQRATDSSRADGDKIGVIVGGPKHAVASEARKKPAARKPLSVQRLCTYARTCRPHYCSWCLLTPHNMMRSENP